MSYDRKNDSFRTSTDIFGGFDSDFGRYDTEYEPGYGTEDMQSQQPVEPTKARKKLRGKKKKKKKRKKKHYLLRFIITIIVLVVLYLFLSSAIFDIEDIRVENNAILSDQQIIDASGIKEGQNIFAAGGFKTKRSLKKNPYVEDVDIDRKLPGKIVISVDETQPTVAIQYSGKYILLNETGEYVDVNESNMYATKVEGIRITSFQEGKEPKFDDAKKFNEVLKLVNGINNAGMFLKKVEISSSLTIKGYISETLMVSGTANAILSNMDNLKYMLYDLDQKGIKRGIIRIGEDGYSSFSPVTE